MTWTVNGDFCKRIGELEAKRLSHAMAKQMGVSSKGVSFNL